MTDRTLRYQHQHPRHHTPPATTASLPHAGINVLQQALCVAQWAGLALACNAFSLPAKLMCYNKQLSALPPAGIAAYHPSPVMRVTYHADLAH